MDSSLRSSEAFEAAPEPFRLLSRRLPGVRIISSTGDTPEGWMYQGTSSDGLDVEVLVFRATPDRPDTASTETGDRLQADVCRVRLEQARSFHHPGVPRILAAELGSEGHLLIVRERSAGERLSDRLARRVPLSSETAVSIGLEASDILAAAHAGGLIHGNLSPAMLLLVGGPQVEGRPAVKVLGLHAGPCVQKGFNDAVSPFASPEQKMGAPTTERSDVYSVGAILSRVWSAVAPEADTSSESLPDRVSPVMEKALRPNPDERYQSMAELAAALRAAAERPPVVAPPPVIAPAPVVAPHGSPEHWKRPSDSMSRRRTLLAGAAAAILVVAVAALGSLGIRPRNGAVPAVDLLRMGEVGEFSDTSRVLDDLPTAGRAASPGSSTSVMPARPFIRTDVAPGPTSRAGHEFAGVVVGAGSTAAAPGRHPAKSEATSRTDTRSARVSPFRRSHPWTAALDGRYYYPSDCPAALRSGDLRFFRTEAEARAGGFVRAPDDACHR